MDEGALVEALRAGDPAAARALIERFQRVVFGLCVRMMGHRQDAEDAMQDAFVRAIRGIGGFDGRRPLRPWLLQIAANRCRSSLRRRARTQPPSESAAEVADHRPGLSDPDGLQGELAGAMARLRPDYRAAFGLFHEQGLDYAEIARALGRPVGTIKTWLHRARLQLAEDLARRGIRP